MQSLLSPVGRGGPFPSAAVYTSELHPSCFNRRPFSVRYASNLKSPHNSLPSFSAIRPPSSFSLLLLKNFGSLEHRRGQFCSDTRASSSPISPTVPPNDEAEKAKLAQVLFLPSLCSFLLTFLIWPGNVVLKLRLTLL